LAYLVNWQPCAVQGDEIVHAKTLARCQFNEQRKNV